MCVPVECIPQCNGNLVLLGVAFQSDCKFTKHVKLKLTKANNCLPVLRTLRKEHYHWLEIDHLFRSLVLPNITRGLSVYRASASDLGNVQRFSVDRCHKRSYISMPGSIYDLLRQQDTRIFNVTNASDNHRVSRLMLTEKDIIIL